MGIKTFSVPLMDQLILYSTQAEAFHYQLRHFSY